MTAAKDHDPIIASYTVYLTSTPTSVSSAPTGDGPSPRIPKLYLLQYPAHRPSHKPFNKAALHKPDSLRVKPQTGVLEVEIPIDTEEHYNRRRGSRYGRSLKQSAVAQAGGSHGLAGGFNSGPVGRRNLDNVNLVDVPMYDNDAEEASDEDKIKTQILGGKIVKAAAGDPVYMLGSFRGDELHLSRLTALVQLRPQLHHLDAEDELERGKSGTFFGSLNGGQKGRAGPPGEAAIRSRVDSKPESKALDLKFKGQDENDVSRGNNAKLLRAIQDEPWQKYLWIDEMDGESWDKFENDMHLAIPADEATMTHGGSVTRLKSSMTNQQWLDEMSAPRVEGHGKKGLMGKLKGREREKARRRKENEIKARKKREAREMAGLVEAEMEGGDKSATSSELSPAPSALSDPDSDGFQEVDATEVDMDTQADGGSQDE